MKLSDRIQETASMALTGVTFERHLIDWIAQAEWQERTIAQLGTILDEVRNAATACTNCTGEPHYPCAAKDILALFAPPKVQ